MHVPFFSRSESRKPISYIEFLFVAVAIVVYVFVTILFLHAQSSYFDEGFTSYLARFSPLDIAHYTALDVHPPLYYIVLHYWQLLVGVDVFWLRFLSSLFGSIAMVFSYLIVRKLFNRKAAALSLVLIILSPLFIRYSEAMRMYTMALAIITAATYVLVLIVSKKKSLTKTRLWVLYGVLVAAGMWTNYFTAFIWLAHGLWLYNEKRLASRSLNHTTMKSWLMAVGLSIVLYLPWLPWLVMRFTDVQSTGFWIKPVSVDTIVSTITTSIVYTNAAQVANWQAVIVCTFVAMFSVVATKVYRQLTTEQRVAFRLLVLCSVVPIVMLIILSLPPFRSSYAYRYVLNGIFMASLLGGIVLAYARFPSHHILKKSILYALVFITLLSGVVTAKYAGNRSLDTGVTNMVAQAITKIKSNSYSGEPIVSRSPYTYYTSALYEDTSHPIYYIYSNSLNRVGSTHMLYDHPEKRGIKNFANFADVHKKLWLIAEDRHGASTPPAPSWRVTNSFVLRDPNNGAPTVYATEYSSR